jgi:hypothetical protein
MIMVAILKMFDSEYSMSLRKTQLLCLFRCAESFILTIRIKIRPKLTTRPNGSILTKMGGFKAFNACVTWWSRS